MYTQNNIILSSPLATHYHTQCTLNLSFTLSLYYATQGYLLHCITPTYTK